MFNFLKRDRGITEKVLEQAMQRAVQRFQSGDSVGAEREVHAVVEQARAEGTDSPMYAKALFNESTVLCGIGDLVRAAACCRAAADVPARNEQGRKDRLTYLMNLGEILTRSGTLDEAEAVLRSSLEDRRSFYGTKHPGYAYGLGSLAELLLTQGKANEGHALIDEALFIYAPIAHQQFPADAALRAFLVKADEGQDGEAFFGWVELPAKVRQEIVTHVLDRYERVEPRIAVEVLKELRTRLKVDSDCGPTALLNSTIALANAARLAEDNDTRIEAARGAVEILRDSDNGSSLVNSLEGLALALSDAGRNEEAQQAYEEAIAVAERIGDAAAAANVLRNQAVWMNELGQADLARDLHEKAVAAASSTHDTRMQGRTACAYGIFLQHQGDFDRARPQLERSLKLLSLDDPDAFYAQDHLLALERHEKCGCGENSDETLTALVERLVMSRAPEGLLNGLRVHMGEDGLSIEVDTSRQPTDSETEELNRVIKVTIAEMQQKYRRAGYGDR